MKLPFFAVLLCLISGITSFAEKTLIVNYAGACDSYNYSIYKICSGSSYAMVQCAQFHSPITQHVWKSQLAGQCSDNPAHFQVIAHTCGYPYEEFLVFDGSIAEGETNVINMSGPCPPIPDPDD